MKTFFAIASLIVAAYARSDDGFSTVSRSEDAHGNHQFSYDITDWDTNQKRWESSDAHNNRKGGYSITDIDGKVRHLEYVADKGGFRAVIKTNEPGTAPGYSGDALYLRDGVKEIITAAQPSLQYTGHVLKQKKIAVAAPVYTHNVQPIQPQYIYQKPAIYQPAPQVYQPAPQIYHHRPMVHYQPPQIFYQQHAIKPVYQPVIQKNHFQVHYQEQPRIHFQQPAYVQPIIHKAVQPVIAKTFVSAPVLVAKPTIKPIIVTSPPAYHGPKRRPAKVILDQSQYFDTPELPKLAPKRIPAYNPEDIYDEEEITVTVAPILKKSFVEKTIAVSKYSPVYVQAPAYPPLAGPPSRRARA